jgi:hypothetical protein
LAGAPFPAPTPTGPAGPGIDGAPGAPAFAAGVKDGETGAVGAFAAVGAPGAVGENRGILAAAVAWEAADDPGAGAVVVGADSDAAGP